VTILAHHGTDRHDFTRFDIAEARPFNIGIHFGTRAAELQHRFERLSDRWMSADDNPRYAADPSLYLLCEMTSHKKSRY